MKFLEIKSKGEMQIEALTLIGASTKRGDDSKIGMFGSGLKYAIAAIVKQDIPFVIFSGKNEIRIGTQEVDFGGKVFNQILINGQPTSLTDSMGTDDWEGAFPFIREIYSNALDEDEYATAKLVEDFTPEEGVTTFVLSVNDDIRHIINNFQEYFSNPNTALENIEDYGSILPKRKDLKIYRKQILCHQDENINSIFSYDCDKVEINESRVVRNIYQVYSQVGYMLERMQNKSLIRQWINGIAGGNDGLFEHKCVLESWQSNEINPALKEVLLESKYYPVELRSELSEQDKEGRLGIQLSLIKRFLKHTPDIDVIGITVDRNGQANKKITEITPSTRLFDKVADSLAILKSTNYKSRLRNEIKYTDFKNENVLGQARNGFIYLSTKLEDYSEAEVAKVIIEEQEHLISGQDDETRAFQNHLFNLYYEQLKLNRYEK